MKHAQRLHGSIWSWGSSGREWILNITFKGCWCCVAMDSVVLTWSDPRKEQAPWFIDGSKQEAEIKYILHFSGRCRTYAQNTANSRCRYHTFLLHSPCFIFYVRPLRYHPQCLRQRPINYFIVASVTDLYRWLPCWWHSVRWLPRRRRSILSLTMRQGLFFTFSFPTQLGFLVVHPLFKNFTVPSTFYLPISYPTRILAVQPLFLKRYRA